MGFCLSVCDGRDDENQSDCADGQQDPKGPAQAAAMLCLGFSDCLYEDIVATALGTAYPHFVFEVGRVGLLGHGERIPYLKTTSSYDYSLPVSFVTAINP